MSPAQTKVHTKIFQKTHLPRLGLVRIVLQNASQVGLKQRLARRVLRGAHLVVTTEFRAVPVKRVVFVKLVPQRAPGGHGNSRSEGKSEEDGRAHIRGVAYEVFFLWWMISTESGGNIATVACHGTLLKNCLGYI
jgi:hypothetical protein